MKRGTCIVMSCCRTVSFPTVWWLCSMLLLRPSRGTKYCDQRVCLSPLGRDSVLWRQCDTLCTSGFVDDLTFLPSPPDSRRRHVFGLSVCRDRPDRSCYHGISWTAWAVSI